MGLHVKGFDVVLELSPKALNIFRRSINVKIWTLVKLFVQEEDGEHLMSRRSLLVCGYC